jgi:hypothetical protein
MNIYWSFDNIGVCSKWWLLQFEPENIFVSMKQHKELEHYLRCPAAVNFLKNTYMIRCPFDYTLEYSETGNVITQEYDQKVFDSSVGFAGSTNMHQCDIFQLTMCTGYAVADTDKNVQLTLLPPYMHDSPLREFVFLPAQYEPNKWLRCVHPVLWNKDKKSIVLKRGDPLCYIHFNTTERVKLKMFEFTPKLRHLENLSVNTKHFIKNKSLANLYSLFAKNNTKKKTLEEVKKNLL